MSPDQLTKTGCQPITGETAPDHIETWCETHDEPWPCQTITKEPTVTTLHPTLTRLTLLRDINAGHVRWNERKGFTAFSTAINAKVAELDRAGWVEIVNTGNRQVVFVTDAGRTVLAAAGTDRGVTR